MHVAIPDLIRRLEIPQEKERAANELIAIGEEAFGALHADMFRPDRWRVSEIEFRILFSINFAKAVELVKKLIVDQPNTAAIAFQSIGSLNTRPTDMLSLAHAGITAQNIDVIAAALKGTTAYLRRQAEAHSTPTSAFSLLNDNLISLTLHQSRTVSFWSFACLKLTKPATEKLITTLSTALRLQVDDPPPEDLYPWGESGPYALFALISAYGCELSSLEKDVIAVLQQSPNQLSRSFAAETLSKMGLETARRALPHIQEVKRKVKFERVNDNDLRVSDAIRDIKLAIKKSEQNLDADPSVLDLVARLRQWDGTGSCPAEKAKQELRQNPDPSLVSKVRNFLSQKLTTDQFGGACEILEQLIIGSGNADAKSLLLEMFHHPKTPPEQRNSVLSSLTSAKVPGATKGAIPFLESRDKWVSALGYFKAVPEEEASEALGAFFLKHKSSDWRGGLIIRDAMLAVASKKLSQYAVSLLSSDNDINDGWKRSTALEVIKAAGEKPPMPLLIREMETGSAGMGLLVIELFGEALDEQAYRPMLKILDEQLKKRFETKAIHRGWDSLRLAWAYFQRLKKDYQPEVVAMINRLSKPHAWNRVDAKDKEFFRSNYSGVAQFPPLPDPPIPGTL